MENSLFLNSVENIKTLNAYRDLLIIKDRLNSMEHDSKRVHKLSDKDLVRFIQDILSKIKSNDRFLEYITLEIINSLGNMIETYKLNRSILPTLGSSYTNILEDLSSIQSDSLIDECNTMNFDINKYTDKLKTLGEKINRLINDVFSVITYRENYILVWSLAVQFNTLKIYSK